MPAPIIRPVHESDFEEWSRIRRTLYNEIDDAFEEQERLELIANPEWGCFVAEDAGGRIVGMLEMSLRNIVDGCLTTPVAYIEGIYLDPEVRGAGWGHLLVRFAEEWGRSKGCREIATDCELGNSSAESFHLRMGFEEVGRVIEFRKDL